MSEPEPVEETATPEESLEPDRLEEAEEKTHQKFGTFGGVFTPTLLTILGVIMFLREGWIIGNAGLLGGLLIIGLGFAITTFTALAMSSITTNIRIGAGGAYAVIAQSLGLEVGGSVGIPRYLSQALAVTMYIFGFREGWLYLFPDHSAILVDVATFLLLYAIAYVSANFAIRVQYLIMAVIAAGLVSIGVAAGTGSMQYGLGEIQLWGDFVGSPENDFGGTSFWVVFAVFFPATTGIMAGANMSGDLRNPKRSIPVGTLAAIGVSFVIYVLLAVWLAASATPEELTSNYTVMMDKAYWPRAVLAGLLGATFSSALASLVGAGRILQAMGEHHVVPGSDWLAYRAANGEPRHAMMVTGGLIFASLLFRDLNAIAPLITMFFLVTYAMINAAVLIEQGLDLVSFRPLLRIPPWVSFLGLTGSLLAMFIINPTISFLALIVTLGFYVYLTRLHLDAPFEDVRSGLFVALAEWAAKKVTELPTMQERAWKPNLMVPLERGRELRGTFTFLRNLTYPQGSLKLIGLTKQRNMTNLEDELEFLADGFRDEGVFTQSVTIESDSYLEGTLTSLQALTGAFFSPNIIFLTMPGSEKRRKDLESIIRKARDYSMGILLFAPDPVAQLGRRSTVNVWVSDMSPNWRPENIPVSLHLSLLAGYKLEVNWKASLRIICGVPDQEHREDAELFLENLLEQARLSNTKLHLYVDDFEGTLRKAPQADLDIFGLTETPNFGFMREMVETTESACLFVKDSGRESVLA